MRILTLVTLIFLSLTAYAEDSDYEYQLSGSYSATLPGLSQKQNIKFTLQWNESKQIISGTYKDSFFTNGSDAIGTVSAEGRVFNVRLSRMIQNVTNLSLTANNSSVKIFMKNPTQMTIDQVSIEARAQKNIGYIPKEKSECTHCEIYSGSIHELTDSNNKCLLPDYNFRMELSSEKKLTLYFYYSDIVIGIPTHDLGVVKSDSDKLEQVHENCGVLVGTNFLPESCQKLTLSGNFSGDSFRGRYEIEDQKSFERCSYELVLRREDKNSSIL